tara:strand:- start:500 stop:1852 length:1353 start_codon:yes stop_codon:yes gene_type:complete
MKNLLNLLNKGTFPTLIALSALSVSASAAFYSVSGLSKLFAGASFEVIIMAGSLEVAKLVTASLLYQYWDTINKILRTYLAIATIILVLITSMGIYGFLSAAYQETYQKLVVNQNKIEFLENKAKFYEDDVIRYDEELERISGNISTLSGAKATSIQVRDTAAVGGLRSTVSTAELRLAQSRISVEEENRKEVNVKRTIAADSLQKFKLQILDLQNTSDTVGELGPLQYISGLTGTPMDKIINWLLLVIIFVFDPLAISLVVAANFAFTNAFPKREEDILSVFDNDEEFEEEEPSKPKSSKDFLLEDWNEDEAEKRMNIIGQNGNEGEHYDDTEIQNTIRELGDKIENNELKKEVNSLQSKLSLANEEINELDRGLIKTIDGIKHINDYLKHHGGGYDGQAVNFDKIKLGFAEKDDYIKDNKPSGKKDPYLDKNIDPDYPTKDGENIITY